MAVKSNPPHFVRCLLLLTLMRTYKCQHKGLVPGVGS